MKNFVLVLIILGIFCAACSSGSKSAESDGIFDFGASDETDQAAELVTRANEDLREIRKIQKANNGKIDELKNAMSNRDSESVKRILDELIQAISDGLQVGETARARIDDATEKKTNEKFIEYLRLKEQALRKQIDAFEFRRNAAKILREKFGSEDTAVIEKAKADFSQQEDSFQKLMEVAAELNDRAERLRRENPGKIKSK